MSTLQDVTIGIGSFLRPGYLKECFNGIETNLPECKVVIADDSGDIQAIQLAGNNRTTQIYMPFDSGITAKRNACVKATKTKYFLLGCDDFDFSMSETREGIIKMMKVLDDNYDIDVAVGRFHNNPYEGFIEYVPGSHIKENRLTYTTELPFHIIELGVNYFLARTESIVPWDEQFKIGGEHVDWFMDMKTVQRKIVWVPGVNIDSQPYNAHKQDPRYASFRSRCWDGHAQMKKKRNIKQYIDFGGGIS